MFSRAGRAALLNRAPFTEAYFDSNAAADGAILVAIAAAVPYLLDVFLESAGDFAVQSLFGVVIGGVISWLILGFATWFAATRLFGSMGRPQIMLGLHGLAALPLILEGLGTLGAAVGLVWYLAVLVVATREASELSTRDAAVSVLIGFAAAILIRALIRAPFAILGSLF
jgi:hypothetical protein